MERCDERQAIFYLSLHKPHKIRAKTKMPSPRPSILGNVCSLCKHREMYALPD